LQVYLSANECCSVRAGDTLGYYNHAAVVVSEFYVDNVGIRLSESDADTVQVGDQLKFDSLPFPYRISLAAAYDTGVVVVAVVVIVALVL